MDEDSDFGIEDVSAYVANTLLMHEETGVGTPNLISITLADGTGVELASLSYPFDMVENDKSDADTHDIIRSTVYHIMGNFIETQPALFEAVNFVAFLVLHPDIAVAERWAAFAQDGLEAQEVEVFGGVATDGTKWSDIVFGESGEVPDGLITDFQLARIVNGDDFDTDVTDLLN